MPISCLISQTVSSFNKVPLILISPSCGKSKPFISFAMVDFPDPLCPIIATVSPASISKEQSFSTRSEEHTSELQSRFDLVCRLLLESSSVLRHLHSFPTRRSSDLILPYIPNGFVI